MTINQVTSKLKEGKIGILPNWVGYFYWDFSKKEIYFRNNDYYLNLLLLIDKGIFNRKDWYYII